jgi:hypothetical protein
VRRFRFLLDRDVSKAFSLFPRRRAQTIADAGLSETAEDAAIVEKAWELEAIIVTSNGDDFFREMRRFSQQTKRKDCHDLFGLVVLPNKFEIQKRILGDLASRLRFKGKQITWDDVWRKNLCVRGKATGNPEIAQLPRCFYCQRRLLKRQNTTL